MVNIGIYITGTGKGFKYENIHNLDQLVLFVLGILN